MPHHEGVEERPTGLYFGDHDERMSQGDIYDDVPLVLHPATPEQPPELTSGEAMVLTASCQIDQRLRDVLIAPVMALVDLHLSEGVVKEMEALDCQHRLMYLPGEGGRPERAVRLDRAQAIDRLLLESFARRSQLTAEATRQLMRKIVLWYTGNHFPRARFTLPPDDFLS